MNMWQPKMYEVIEKGLYSVKLLNTEDDREYWVDVQIVNGDVETDWNQYIFSMYDEDDLARKQVQDDAVQFDYVVSEAVGYLEDNNIIRQTEDGNWLTIAED